MFQNREDAGRQLAQEVKKAIKDSSWLVVGIVRGGIVLAKIIADNINGPLEALVIRKIGAPYNSELAIGAIGPKRIVYWDDDLINRLSIDNKYRQQATKQKAKEVENLEKIFSINKKELDFKDKRVILVDDGVATGTTVMCAQKILKMQNPTQLILATPVIPKESYAFIGKYFDNVIALEKPFDFSAVGQFYRDFPQVGDEEVVGILNNKL